MLYHCQFIWNQTYVIGKKALFVKVSEIVMTHSKRIIIFLTFLFILGIVFQPAYAANCDRSDPCMPSQHASHTASTGHSASAGHKSCNCSPITNCLNSTACHQKAAYAYLEMAVLRLDSDDTLKDGNACVAKYSVLENKLIFIRTFGMPASPSSQQKLPIYLQTLTLLI